MSKAGSNRLSIMALGLRGIPNVPGGVETHASEIYPRLQALGATVTVLGRNPYRPADSPQQWRGVNVRWIPSPKIEGVEALVHSFLGVMYAAARRPDILHIHAVGPWLFAPLAKLFGLKVVVTHHGQDYLREKWHGPARALLRLGERVGMSFADEVIVISRSIADLALHDYGRQTSVIPNGVADLRAADSTALLERYGLERQRYVIQVSRLVPEKRQLDLIAAFKAAQLPGWTLLLVGGAQGSQRYADLVRTRCSGDPSIVTTGFLPPPEVQQLLSQAGVFALPSSHEGLPISLLEAMWFGTPSVASDIAANRETGLADECYFPVGDITALSQRLRVLAAATPTERSHIAEQLRDRCARYNWDEIADSTLQVMRRAAARSAELPLQSSRRPDPTAVN
jgi:glycosyltransferase involved in cell wall biosynthesis